MEEINYCLFCFLSNTPAPVPGKFMVCMGHRLQCKMPNCTNHKFPRYGAEFSKGSEIDSTVKSMDILEIYRILGC